MKFKVLIFVFFLASKIAIFGQSQSQIIDSLIVSLKTAEKDSVIVNNYIYLSSYFFEKNFKKSKYYANQALDLAGKLNYKTGQAQSLFLLGNTEHKLGKLKSALKHYLQASLLYKNQNKNYYLARSYAEMGNVQASLGDMVSSIKNHQKAISILKGLDNSVGVAHCYSDLGSINHMQKNYEQSLSYFTKAKKIFEHEKDDISLAKLYNRVSLVFRDKGEIDKSLSYDYKALLIQEQLRDQTGMAQSNLNIGETSILQKEWKRAQGYIDYAAKLYRDTEDQIGISKCYLINAKIALLQHKINIAKDNLERCIDIAIQSNALPELVDAYGVLSEIYAGNNEKEKAYDYLIKHNNLKDTLFSIERSRQFSEMEVKYQTEIIEEKLEEANVEKEEEANKAFTFTLSFFLGSGIFLVIVLLMKRKHKESQDNNKHLERKNKLIEKKNNEILDSILYAKRIQEAMLTSTSYIDQIFEEYMIFFRPKDIVSGDFYWAYQNKSKNTIYWATADCTGHGVPGALMSMIGTVLLNEAVIVKKLEGTDVILSQMSSYLQRYLNRTDSLYQTQDGMDIAFCKLNQDNLMLEVSGATHSIYIIRDGQLEELKGDKITLGQDPYGRSIDNFTVTNYQLESGDLVYTFTDGFPDQIGGENRKKFKVGALKNLLLEISHLSLAEQRHLIKDSLSNWQGQNPQLDDILIMGVRV